MTDETNDGARAAAIDLARGNLRYKWIGHGGPGGVEFCRLVRERWGMEVDDFGICMVSDEKLAFARDYNETVRGHLFAAHGRDVIEETLAEARASHKARYDQHFASVEEERDGPPAPESLGKSPNLEPSGEFPDPRISAS